MILMFIVALILGIVGGFGMGVMYALRIGCPCPICREHREAQKTARHGDRWTAQLYEEERRKREDQAGV